jgi:Na+/proline symporter
MNKLSSQINLVATRFDSRTIRLVVTLASLVMFVLAAGAPDSVGGIGMQ